MKLTDLVIGLSIDSAQMMFEELLHQWRQLVVNYEQRLARLMSFGGGVRGWIRAADPKIWESYNIEYFNTVLHLGLIASGLFFNKLWTAD